MSLTQDLFYHIPLDIKDAADAEIRDDGSSTGGSSSAAKAPNKEFQKGDFTQSLLPSGSKTPGTAFNSARDVLIIKKNNHYYLANPYYVKQTIPTGPSAIGPLSPPVAMDAADADEYLILTHAEYNQKIKDGKIKPNLSHTWEWAVAVGWGDFTWLAANEIIMGIAKAAGAANAVGALLPWAFPLILGAMVYKITLAREKERFIIDNGRNPTTEETAIMEQDAMAVGFKMCAAVFGWTAAAVVFDEVIKPLFTTGLYAAGGPLGHAIAAITVGLGAALFIGFAAYSILKYQNGGKLKEGDWQIIFKVAACSFVAGALWWVCYSLPGITGMCEALDLGKGPGENSTGELFGYLLSSLLVFAGVSTAFAVYNKDESWHTFKHKHGTSTLAKAWQNTCGTKPETRDVELFLPKKLSTTAI